MFYKVYFRVSWKEKWVEEKLKCYKEWYFALFFILALSMSNIKFYIFKFTYEERVKFPLYVCNYVGIWIRIGSFYHLLLWKATKWDRFFLWDDKIQFPCHNSRAKRGSFFQWGLTIKSGLTSDDMIKTPLFQNTIWSQTFADACNAAILIWVKYSQAGRQTVYNQASQALIYIRPWCSSSVLLWWRESL
jgi:hypothetical protein